MQEKTPSPLPSFTVSDLVRFSGAKPRSLQVWTDAGVLLPLFGTDRGGSGAYRRYPYAEAELACIIAALSSAWRLPVGSLKSLSQAIRNRFAEAARLFEQARLGHLHPEGASQERLYRDGEAIERARRLHVPVWLVLSPLAEGGYDMLFVSGAVIALSGSTGESWRERQGFLAVNLTAAIQGMAPG